MRFSRFAQFPAFLSIFAVLLTSCGKLDDKPATDGTLRPLVDTGCYDQLGERVRRYFNGEIEEAEWTDTFDCVKKQITFFRKYVEGEVPGGYVPADIASMIRRFLIVRRPISDHFVEGLFELKASAFGGSKDVITHGDLEEFLRMNEVLRKESLKLLPALKARKLNPNARNLLRLADGIEEFGRVLGKYLSGLRGTMDVRKESFIPLAREILTINGGDGTLIDRYGDFVRNLKVVIAGGSADLIEKGAWSTLVREGAAFGGLLLAYRDMEDSPYAGLADGDELIVELVRRGQKAANRVIASHGTGIPLEVLDPVVDTLPWDSLTKDKRKAIKKDLRPVVFRSLQSGVPGWLTKKAVANAVGLYVAGTTSQMHAKRIFATLAQSSDRSTFEAAARAYRSSLPNSRRREEVDSLIEVAKTYVGLFPEGTPQIRFTNEMKEKRTQNHMIRMGWYQHIISYLFSVYATGPQSTPGKRAAREEDLIRLTDDFRSILEEWKLADPNQTSAEMAEKRFREANLFMPNSNGDRMVTSAEATYYLAFLISSSGMSGKVFTTIMEEWRACPFEGRDILDQPAMPAECFRKHYFDHPEIFWKEFPGLQVAYAKMSESEKASLKYSMEVAARRGGYSQDPIGPYDIDSFSALPHYVEDIMNNFDANLNEVLDRDEILDRAFPIFKTTLSAYSKNTGIQKAILTYVIHYGKEPPTTAAVLAWWVRMPFVKIEADRRALYQVVAVLSSKKKKMLDVPHENGEKGAWAALDAVSSF